MGIRRGMRVLVAVVVGRTALDLLRLRRPLRRGTMPRYIEGDLGRGVLEVIEMSIMVLEGSWVPPLPLFIIFCAFGSQIGLRGYHALHSSFGKVFNVEKRWKIIREMGSGAYGFVVFVNPSSSMPTSGRVGSYVSVFMCLLSRSAADEISGEVVAIKLVTRVTERVQLSKRALREITLLRHFSHHENITGLIDVDASSPNLEEM